MRRIVRTYCQNLKQITNKPLKQNAPPFLEGRFALFKEHDDKRAG